MVSADGAATVVVPPVKLIVPVPVIPANVLTPVTPKVPPTVVFPDIAAVLEAVKAPPDVNTSVVTVPVKVGPAFGANVLKSTSATASSTYFFVAACKSDDGAPDKVTVPPNVVAPVPTVSVFVSAILTFPLKVSHLLLLIIHLM